MNVTFTQVDANQLTRDIVAPCIADAGIISLGPDQNLGGSPYIIIHSGEYVGRGLVQFDLSNIPSGERIVSAILLMQVSLRYVDTSPSDQIAVHQIVSPWTENDVTWGNQVNFLSPPYSAASPAETGSINAWDVTELVRGWINYGIVNYGMLIKFVNEASPKPNVGIGFVSREGTANGTPPKLKITLETPTSGITSVATTQTTSQMTSLITSQITSGITSTITSQTSRITTATSETTSYATSPLGGRIVFSNFQDHIGEIYVINTDGSGLTQLTHNTYWDDYPAWSPDGTKIVFAREFGTANGVVQNWEILVMNADGTGEIQLTNNNVDDWDPAWSPDDTRIAFSRGQGNGVNFDIYVMNADGSNVIQLTDTPTAWEIQPAWSPDGSKIAFSGATESGYEIFVMNSDGSGRTQLTYTSTWNGDPAWSPDGSKIAFVSQLNGQHIWVMNVDGSNQHQIVYDSQFDSQPAWSPDGSRIVYSSLRYGQDLWIMNPDGSHQIQLTNGINSCYHPNWHAGPYVTTSATTSNATFTTSQSTSLSTSPSATTVTLETARTVTMTLTTTLEATVTTHGNELKLQVLSNSTITSLFFDSNRRLINFTASGPEGTKGFCNVIISKELLDGAPIVFIDGNQIAAIVNQDTINYYVHFTYSHSSHKITIGGLNTIPEFPTSTVLILAIISTLVLKRRKQGPSTRNSPIAV